MKAPRSQGEALLETTGRPKGHQWDGSCRICRIFQAESTVQAKSNDFSNVNQGGSITADNASRPEGIYSLGDIVRAQKEQQRSPEEHP